MEASRKARRETNKQKEGNIGLDAKIWGELQHHIPLQIVYEKLSPDDLSRLRLVCKVWNHAALQRLLPKPSFVIITPFEILNGIVTYDVISRRFGFKRYSFPLMKRRIVPPSLQSHVQPFETEGLILCQRPDDCAQRGVFNVHTQMWHEIPPPPPRRWESLSACGLMVDTSLKPYTFKLIEGNLDNNTRIYDSKTRTWSTTSSHLLQATKRLDLGSLRYTCICSNGHVYISLPDSTRSEDGFMILKYSLEDDLWTTLKFPELDCSTNPGILQPDNPLGVWEGRIFTTRDNSEKHRVTVWELVDSERQIWEEYAHTTKKQYHKWLRNCDCDDGLRPPLRSFFRDGYLLVAMRRWCCTRLDALAMFNMATKKWQKVRLPKVTRTFGVQEPVSSENLSESDDDSEEDVEG